MADNYLERKMEEYRSGRLQAGSRHASARAAHGGLTLEYHDINLLVVAPVITETVDSLVAQGVKAGCRVALLSDDRKGGTALAQRAGTRFYPGLPLSKVTDDILGRWGSLDVILHTEDIPDIAEMSPRIIRLADHDAPAHVVARYYLFLAHPDNEFLTNLPT